VSTDLAEPAFVRPRRQACTFSTLRGHAISQISALVFLTLILVPFTAPFKTFELHGSHRSGSQDGLPKDKISSSEKLVPQATGSLVPPTLTILTVKTAARRHQIQDPPFRSTILRI
jgi:hypothetical protein